MRLLRHSYVLGFALILAETICSPARADFVAVGHPNFAQSGTEGFIFIFGSEGTSGTATSNDGFSQPFTIDASGVAEILVPEPRFLNQADTVLGKAIRVEADNPVSGSFLNRRRNSSDMSLLFDIDGLGTNFRVLSWEQDLREGLQFSITAVEDATSVTVTPSTDLKSGQTAGVPFNVTLDAGQSVKYLAANDPSGTEIDSDRPLAVFAGAACAEVPLGVAFCDHLFSQIPATTNYATEFVVPETANTGSAGNLVRILAATDATVITVNGAPVATLDAGEFHQIDSAGDLAIESSNPVLVGQYLKGQAATGFGDPAFSVVPGLDQLLSAYAYTTPTGSAAYDDNFLNIAIETDSLGTLMLNGSSVNTSGFGALSGTDFSVGSIAVPEGAGFIEADVPFLATLSGFEGPDSYHSIIGATFSAGASPVEPTGPALSCEGFLFPMDQAVTVKRYRNTPPYWDQPSVLPLTMRLFDEAGEPVYGQDLSSPPVLEVLFDGEELAEVGQAVPDELPFIGYGDEGNRFEFVNGYWQFYLGTSGFGSTGTYYAAVVSGDESEYVVDPTCVGTFTIDNPYSFFSW